MHALQARGNDDAPLRRARGAPPHCPHRTMQLPHYQPESPYQPLSDDELAALDDLLAGLSSDAAMNIEALDGYLCGLLLSPVALPTLPGATWLPQIWGGDSPGADDNAPFVSSKQRKRAVLLILRHLRALDTQLHDDPDAWEPILSVAEEDEGECVDALDFCTGFMLAVDLAPEAWGTRFQDPEFAPLLAPIALLGGDEGLLSAEQKAQIADLQQLDGLSREVPDAVLAMAARVQR